MEIFYEFETSVGIFTITPNPDAPVGVVLSIDNVRIGRFDTAADAAKAVYAQETGWERWDLLQDISGPRDLSEWKGGGT